MAEEAREASLPYAVSTDPETARSLFREGATLLFVNVPTGTLVGLDGQVFTVGPNFLGVKMIPPGVHLVTTQAVQSPSRHDDRGQQHQGAAAAAAPALAAFLDLGPRSVLVRGWDARAEALAALADAEEEARFAEGARLGDFDRGLAPYDLGAVAGAAGAGAATTTTTTGGWARWRSLAGLITPALARRLMPAPLLLPDGRECAAPISVTAEAAGEGGAAAQPPPSAAERRLDAQLAEGRRRRQEQQHQPNEDNNALVVLDATTPPPSNGSLSRLALAAAPEPSPARYTPIERLSKPQGLTPAQLTEANLDKSTAAEALLMAVVARAGGEGEAGAGASSASLFRLGGPLLLGELQFAFAAFAAGGQSLEGFHQWRSIACLLLGCERLVVSGKEGEEEAGGKASSSSSAAAAFFAAFLRILAAQLRYALGGGFQQQQSQQHPHQQGPAPLLVDDDLLRQSFLRRGVRRFCAVLREGERARGRASSSSPSLAEVRAAAQLVVEALKDGGFGLSEDGDDDAQQDDADDDDDDGPTVVDLDEGYAL